MKAPVLLAFLLPALASAQPKPVDGAVAMLYEEVGGANKLFRCTATAIGEKIWLSAAHCVQRENQFGGLETSKNRFFLSTDSEADEPVFKRAAIKVVGSQEDGYDFLILECKLAHSATLTLGDEKKEKRGAGVLAWASPMGMGIVALTGHIAKLAVERSMVNPEEHSDWSGDMLVQMPALPGASGSSIVSVDTGEVVGILVAGGGGLTLAVPISRVKELIAEALKP